MILFKYFHPLLVLNSDGVTLQLLAESLGIFPGDSCKLSVNVDGFDCLELVLLLLINVFLHPLHELSLSFVESVYEFLVGFEDVDHQLSVFLYSPIDQLSYLL